MHATYAPCEADGGHVAYRPDAGSQPISGMGGACGRDPSVRPSAWRAAVIVLIAAAGILFNGKSIVGKMFHKTRGVGWTTPAGSASLLAETHINEFFPQRMQGAIVMAVEARKGTHSVLTDIVAEFSRNVSDSVARDSRVKPYAPIVIGYYLDVLGFQPSKELMRSEFVSPDSKMTVLFIQPTKRDGDWGSANSFLQEFCSNP
ncbi:unnamed protein product, partial [Polarella glacialis]